MLIVGLSGVDILLIVVKVANVTFIPLQVAVGRMILDIVGELASVVMISILSILLVELVLTECEVVGVLTWVDCQVEDVDLVVPGHNSQDLLS